MWYLFCVVVADRVGGVYFYVDGEQHCDRVVECDCEVAGELVDLVDWGDEYRFGVCCCFF